MANAKTEIKVFFFIYSFFHSPISINLLQIARLAKTLTMDGVKNVPSKHDVGGKSELEQYEETLEKENQKASSETTDTTADASQQNYGEDEDLSMLC